MEFEYDKKAHAKKSNKTDSDDRHGDGVSKHHHTTPSSSELMSSAKTLANAAKAQFQHDPNYKFDKGELAGAAENVLHAASHYGKLDQKGGGLGKMMDQAESYLHKYHSSQTTTTKPDHSTTTTTTTTTTAETIHTKPHKDEQGHSSGGYGEYIKMAEGLLNKHSGSGEEGQHGHGQGHDSGSGGGGGGYGDYIKMAGNFLKK